MLMVVAVMPPQIAAVDQVQPYDGGGQEGCNAVAADIVGAGHAAAVDGGTIVAGNIGKGKVVDAHLDGVLHGSPLGEGLFHCSRLDEGEEG